MGGVLLSLGAQSAPGEEAPPEFTGEPPRANMAGWWDASTLTTAGASAYNTDIWALADRNGTSRTANGGGARAFPHLAGMLSGMYAKGSPSTSRYLHPVIADYGLGVDNIPTGAGALTVLLVWSRANPPRTGDVLNQNPVTLLSIGGTPVLGMTSRCDGTDTLVLFPNGAATPAGTLKLRHTHAARLVFSGASVDLWLDGAKVISAASAAALGASANLAFVPSAQLVFHEAAAWNKALSSSEQVELSAYVAGKWPLGERRAVNGVLVGQSNANNMSALLHWSGALDAIGYLTGCISSNMLYRSGGEGTLKAGGTIFSGTGIYEASDNLILNSSSGPANVANWPLGANGRAFMAALNSMSADQKANLRYIAWFWSESDSSVLTYADKATYTAAMKRAFSLIREHLGMPAAHLPVLVINALPFAPSDAGVQTHREVMADLVADTSLNVHFMLTQAGDADGDSAHRNETGLYQFLRRMTRPIARAALAAHTAAGTQDAITAIEPSVPTSGGPRILSAQYEAASNTVLVTVQHDGGDDLAFPGRAAQGAGFSVMDGLSASTSGTPGQPGALIAATAATKLSATQFRLSLASVPSFPVKAQLYYGYGDNLDANYAAVIGQGNAVTDNFKTRTLAPGWSIGADVGADLQANQPLQATTYGIALT